MPVWNGDRYLVEAIESLLSQSLRDFELVIVDDGSEDRTREIVADYAQSDGRVRPVHAAHRGLVAALNNGCQVARGKYIARLDYDDIALPERLEKQAAYLEAHPRVAMVGAAFRYITAAGERTIASVWPPTDDASIRQRLNEANCFCHSSIMMRKDVVARVGWYRQAFTDAEDYDLWMRLADHHELASIPAQLVLYRLHPQQASLTRVERQGLIALAVRVSTDLRRRTGQDPLAQCERIERTTLQGLGISDDEIDTHLIRAYLKCIAAMPKLGLGRAALDALREVITHRSVLRELESIPEFVLQKT